MDANYHEEARHQVRAAANIAKLPELCFVAVATSHVLCIIKRGERGYYLTDWPVKDYAQAQEMAKERNARMGLTDRAVLAMECGSLAGWHCPGADIDYEPKKS